MDWDAVSKVAAVGLTAAAGVLRFGTGAGPRSRTKLKADCELLATLDESDPSYGVIKGHIDQQILRIYADPRGARRNLTLVGSAIYVLAGIGVATYFYFGGFAWYWYLIPGYLILLGIFAPLLRFFLPSGTLDLRLEQGYAELGRKVFERSDIRSDAELKPVVESIRDLKQRKSERTDRAEAGAFRSRGASS